MKALASKNTVNESLTGGHKTAKPLQTPVNPLASPPIAVPYVQRKPLCACDGGCPRCSGMIQPKLTIGQPNDKYEQEADQVADQVMRMPEPVGSLVNSHWSLGKGEKESSLVNGHSSLVQRQADCTGPACTEEEEPVQTKTIGYQITPIDYVQRQEETIPEEEEEEEVQPKLNDNNQIQRQVEEEPEEEEEEPVQAKPANNQTSSATSNIESGINSLKGGGQPLPEFTLSFLEPRFGADFSHVRVHTDSRAAEAAKSINAKAFTTGKDVVFGSGQYSPGTVEGKKLLAHELTHVVQQNQDSQRTTPVGRPGFSRKSPIPNVFQRVNRKMIQCVQVGYPSRDHPNFEYLYDSTIGSFADLARYYGVENIADIRVLNRGWRRGSPVFVPAVHPPSGPFPGGSTPGVIVGSNRHPLNVRWSPHANGNIIGQLSRGVTVRYLTLSSGFRRIAVELSQLSNQRRGIVIELRRRRLITAVGGTEYVVGYVVDDYVVRSRVGALTSNALKVLAVAMNEFNRGIVEDPPCSNRGPDIDVYTGRRGTAPVHDWDASSNTWIRRSRGTCGPAWCLFFIMWCMGQVGVNIGGLNARASSVSNEPGYRRFGTAASLVPQPGDIFYISPGGSGSTHRCDNSSHQCISSGPGSGHAGFVLGHTAGSPTITTIEGNAHIEGLPPNNANDGVISRTRRISDLDGVLRIP